MNNRFFRFGVWLAALTMGLANAAPALADTSRISLTALASNVVINEVLPSPSTGNVEYIELYNPTSTAKDLSGWSVSSSTGLINVFPAGTVLPAGNVTAVNFFNMLDDREDSVTLKTAAGSQVDQVRYGLRASAQLRAPNTGRALGRLGDGDVRWYTNILASYGVFNAPSNAGVTTLQPVDAFVRAGAANATHMINTATATSAQVDVVLPATALASETVMADLVDHLGTVKSGVALGRAGSGSVTTTAIDTTAPTALADGSLMVRAFVTNALGISTVYSVGTSALLDTVAPDGTVTINGGASVTSSSTVTLTITGSDMGGGVTQMRLGNVNTFSGRDFETFATTRSWPLVSGDGLRSVYLQVKDLAGNVSPARNILSSAESVIRVEQDARSITVTPLAVGSQTIKNLPTEVTVTATATTPLTLATYLTNPGAAFPTGLTNVGQTVEVGVGDVSRVQLPVQVKVYYTLNDLTALGSSDERRLLGLARYDDASGVWQMIDSTGVSTADVTVDGVSYAGFFYANTTKFGPMTGIADMTAPAQVATPTVTIGTGSTLVKWNLVSGATSYVVRYRAADATTDYTTVGVGETVNQVRITNLENGRRYEFGIASRDSLGNTSGFATEFGTPSAEAQVITEELTFMTTPEVLAPISNPAPRQVVVPQPTATATPTPSPTPSATSTTDEETDEATDEDRDFGRLLMILAILIIAIGAGTTGYYGYQWLAAQPTEVQPPKTNDTKPPTAAGKSVEPQAPAKPVEPPKSDNEPKGRW